MVRVTAALTEVCALQVHPITFGSSFSTILTSKQSVKVTKHGTI